MVYVGEKKIVKELGVGEVAVGDWRRKHAKIRKWSGVLTSDDCLEKQKNNVHKVIIKKQMTLSFCGFLNKVRRACQHLA